MTKVAKANKARKIESNKSLRNWHKFEFSSDN